jgi:glutamate dehydrogenase (NAD(P)+)
MWASHVRANRPCAAPDVNTNEQVMAWMTDTCSMNEGTTASGVVAVQAHGGTVYKGAGLDVPALLRHVGEHGSVNGFTPAETLPDAQFWRVDCDILIPAALEQQITAANAHQIQARMVIEGANGPTTPEADDINTRLVRIMREAFAAIWQVADEHNISLRTATFVVACSRILQARELRGLYP